MDCPTGNKIVTNILIRNNIIVQISKSHGQTMNLTIPDSYGKH